MHFRLKLMKKPYLFNNKIVILPGQIDILLKQSGRCENTCVNKHFFQENDKRERSSMWHLSTWVIYRLCRTTMRLLHITTNNYVNIDITHSNYWWLVVNHNDVSISQSSCAPMNQTIFSIKHNFVRKTYLRIKLSSTWRWSQRISPQCCFLRFGSGPQLIAPAVVSLGYMVVHGQLRATFSNLEPTRHSVTCFRSV